MSTSDIHRRPGGRSARVRRAVLDATLSLIREDGFSQLTVGRVAERARVHDTSIYRRWGTREKLILEALYDAIETQSTIPDTGSLRGDLILFFSELAAHYATPDGHAVVQATVLAVHDARFDQERAGYAREHMARIGKMITRAVARGEIADGADATLAVEMLAGPLLVRTLFTHRPIAEDLAAHIVDVLLRGFGIVSPLVPDRDQVQVPGD